MEKTDNGIWSGNLQVLGQNRPRIETHSNDISSEMLDFVPTLGCKWHNGNEKSSRFYREIVPNQGEPNTISSENRPLSRGKWDNIQGKELKPFQ